MGREGYPWGAMGRFPSGAEITVNQEYFCSCVAETKDLKLLRWVREEKECAWDYRTSGAAAINGNLDILKYCVENGCEVDERHVIAQVPPKTVTSIVSNTYARRTVLGTSEFANSLVKKTTSTYSRTPFETSAQVSKRTNDAFVSNRANELSRLKANKYQKVSQQQRNAFSDNHVTNIHILSAP